MLTVCAQDSQSVWTFDGTLPPKLLVSRYHEPVVLSHYNALPLKYTANRGFGSHFISTHQHNGHNPGESDGSAQAYFLPGQFYNYRWPMILAGHDWINKNATDPRAATPCTPGEVMRISMPGTAPQYWLALQPKSSTNPLGCTPDN